MKSLYLEAKLLTFFILLNLVKRRVAGRFTFHTEWNHPLQRVRTLGILLTDKISTRVRSIHASTDYLPHTRFVEDLKAIFKPSENVRV